MLKLFGHCLRNDDLAEQLAEYCDGFDFNQVAQWRRIRNDDQERLSKAESAARKRHGLIP